MSLNHLGGGGGVVQIFMNNFFFRRPSERNFYFFFAKIEQRIFFNNINDHCQESSPSGSDRDSLLKFLFWVPARPQKINFVFQIQEKWLVQIERWKKSVGPKIKGWLCAKKIKKLLLIFLKILLVDSTLSVHLYHHECDNIGTYIQKT